MYNTDIDKFGEYGYVIITDFLTPQQHTELNQECQSLSQYAETLQANQDNWIITEPGNPCKLDGAMAASSVFRELGNNPTLVSTAKQILQYERLDTYISKFFPMVPNKGFSVDWHQDNHYIQAHPTQLISCDVFVNGADKDNGCIRIVPYSHFDGIRDHTNPSHNGVFRWIDVDDSNVIDIELDQPFAILFDVDLIHGCYTNTSDRYRYSIAWEYINSGYKPKTHNGHRSQDRLPV